MAGSNTPQPASHPFDDPNADLILRSSDKVPTDFRVYKLLLSLASSFFATAFTLPQPESEDGTPVMEMEEDRHTLELVLGLCYPISVKESPPLSSLKDLLIVMRSAVKFEMEGIQKYVQRVVIEPRFIESQPLRVYALACHYGWAKEAREAARYTLRHPAYTPLVDELELISAATYHRLLRYRKECGEAAAAEVAALGKWRPGSDWVWDEYSKCMAKGKGTRRDGCRGPRKWWLGWMQSVGDELKKQPWGEAVKKVDLLEAPPLSNISLCDECTRSSIEQLEEYVHILAGRVDRKISTVKLILRT
ncbi:hypothetical protein FPV67DRAFT_1665873 [Lyophyllum atratum]|nr:hypothetical protein FPV67DRAFT_1665873 [Lyophyllum atratum]